MLLPAMNARMQPRSLCAAGVVSVPRVVAMSGGGSGGRPSRPDRPARPRRRSGSGNSGTGARRSTGVSSRTRSRAPPRRLPLRSNLASQLRELQSLLDALPKPQRAQAALELRAQLAAAQLEAARAAGVPASQLQQRAALEAQFFSDGGGDDAADASRLLQQRAVEWRDAMMGTLREALLPAQSALLDRLLGGPEWPAMAEWDAARMAGLVDGLDEDERGVLAATFARMMALQRLLDADALAGGEEGDDEEGEFLDVEQEGEESEDFESDEDGGGGGGEWDADSEEMLGAAAEAAGVSRARLAERVESLARHSARVQSGVETFGAPMSAEFVELKSITARLYELQKLAGNAVDGDDDDGSAAASKDDEDEGDAVAGTGTATLDGEELAAAAAECDARMAALLQAVAAADADADAAGADVFTRSVLLWMEACITQALPADDDDGDNGSALVAGRTELAALGAVLRAAEGLAALRAWAAAHAAAEPESGVESLLAVAGLDGDTWWLRGAERDAAEAAVLRAMHATAVARGGGDVTNLDAPPVADADDALAAAAAEAAASAGTPNAALRPFVDWQRVEWLAALDPPTLHFLAELTAADACGALGGAGGADSSDDGPLSAPGEDVLIKWSLHPELGPKLMTEASTREGGGLSLVDGGALPEVLARLWDEARAAAAADAELSAVLEASGPPPSGRRE